MDPYQYFKVECAECPYGFHDGLNCPAHDCTIIEQFLAAFFNELRHGFGNDAGFKGQVKLKPTCEEFLADQKRKAPVHCNSHDKLDPGVWCPPEDSMHDEVEEYLADQERKVEDRLNAEHEPDMDVGGDE